MQSRQELLLGLLAHRRTIELITSELARFPWDTESDLVILQRAHLKHVLEKFVVNQMTVASVEAWAEAIEGRDSIGFEVGYEELLKTIIFELATQELGLPLTQSRAETLIEELS